MHTTINLISSKPESVTMEPHHSKIINAISITVNVIWMLSICAIGAYAALTSISVFRWVSKSNVYDILADILQFGFGKLLMLGGINLLAFVAFALVLWIIYNLRQLLHGIKQGRVSPLA